ncbi:hypothetical protein DSUL_130012 [Desulfovibrionales bacterium]
MVTQKYTKLLIYFTSYPFHPLNIKDGLAYFLGLPIPDQSSVALTGQQDIRKSHRELQMI